MIVLPPIEQHPSPNNSDRRGIVPYLIVVHRPVGGYEGSLRTLTDPHPPGGDDRRVSAHILTDSNRVAAQLVRWDRKAWSCAAFNSSSYNLEIDDDAWARDGDMVALLTAARATAYLSTRTGIPPTWTRQPTHTPGVCRHFDLGRAGGGHTDPTTDETLWRGFVEMVRREHERGGFRQTWGVGTLARIDT